MRQITNASREVQLQAELYQGPEKEWSDPNWAQVRAEQQQQILVDLDQILT